MVVSLIQPHTCGFAKVAAWQVTRAVVSEIKRDENESPKDYQARTVQEMFTRFTELFSGNNFTIDMKMFQKKNSLMFARNSVHGILAKCKNANNI